MSEITSTRRLLEQLLAKHRPAQNEPSGGYVYRWGAPDREKTHIGWKDQALARVEQWRRRRSA